jgi:DNA-binding NarL/FixJ family response regulator
MNRALIVEDDSAWQLILSEILSEYKLEIDTVKNVAEAKQKIKEFSHRIALVDLSLSHDHNNTDGLKVLDAIKTLDPNCRAILLTGFSTVEVAVDAITKYGAFTFLRKENFQRSLLKEKIQEILKSAPQHALEPVSAPSTFTSPQALIVDDDAGWRTMLEDLMSELGFQTFTSASFGEAFGLLQNEIFSIALIDLSLKDKEMNGYSLLDYASKNQIPAIVVSGFSEPAEIQKIYQTYKIVAYIEKQNFDRKTFKQIVGQTKQPDPLQVLTEREREVLNLLSQGLTNKEIADKLIITTNTVKRHLKAIFEKLNVHTRAGAVAFMTKKI